MVGSLVDELDPVAVPEMFTVVDVLVDDVVEPPESALTRLLRIVTCPVALPGAVGSKSTLKL
jgi:hypothetical protein